MLYAFFAAASLFSLAAALPANVTERSDATKRATPNAPVYYDCTQSNVIALTFNNGPSDWTEKIVNLLDSYGAKATFFVDGVNNGECIYDKKNVNHLKKALNSGHQIASHGWDNTDYSSLSKSKVGDELDKIDTALEKTLGIKPAFFRPPQYAWSSNILKAAGKNNQAIVYWDFDSGDAEGVSPSDTISYYEEIITLGWSNALALNDETISTTTTVVLPWVLQNLGAAGFKFVTVAECLGGLQPYLSEKAPKKRDSSWKC